MREMMLTIGLQRFVRVKEKNEKLVQICTCEEEGEGVHV